MIRYELRCSRGHEFDGWFKDSVGFDKLATAGLVDCPTCGGTEVAKRLMAPAVRKAPGVKGRSEMRAPRADGPAKPPAPTAAAPMVGQLPGQMAAGPLPAQMVALLQRMRAEVEQRCDYVGSDFADEARRIHKGEIDARAIYGEATDAEAKALRDDGIEVARIPWVPRADG